MYTLQRFCRVLLCLWKLFTEKSVLIESLSGTNFNKFSRLSFPHAERLQPNQDDNKDLLTFQRCMVTFKRYFSVYTDLLPGSHRSLCPDHNESEE